MLASNVEGNLKGSGYNLPILAIFNKTINFVMELSLIELVNTSGWSIFRGIYKFK